MAASSRVSQCMAAAASRPHISYEGCRPVQTAGRSGEPKRRQRSPASSWTQGTPAGLPPGMPGMGELMEGAVQQAPQPLRHEGGESGGGMQGLEHGRRRRRQATGRMYKFWRFVQMQTLPLSEFRANASAMLDLVEKGETVRILRHGKPVADLVPVQAASAQKVPSWKRKIEPLRIVRPDGKTGAQLIIEEREQARY